jgi:thymidylate synthase (FAD)
MGKLVTPEVYWIGYTRINGPELERYLKDSGNEEFLDDVYRAREEGLSDGEILCSFMAKLCYASLTVGHNDNITQVRDIAGNIKGCFDQGHGSVFEHANLSFVARNCSRVLTHELVRHRVGTAFSQTSGRYVRGDSVDLAFDPILEPVRGLVERLQAVVETDGP